MHVLKQAYQPQRATRSWKRSEIAQAAKIEVLVRESPSLRPQIDASFPDAYRRARRLAAVETGLDIATFPLKPADTVLAALYAVLDGAGIEVEPG